VDSHLFRVVNDLAKHTAWLHGFAVLYAKTLGPALLAALVLLAVWRARRTESRSLALAGWAGLAPLAAVALNQPLVHLVWRDRPYATLDHVLVLVHRSADASFPSDHSVLAGSVLAALLLLDRRVGALAAVVGVLLAASRVYVGAHYPGDVVAGLVVGAAVALGGWALLERTLTALVERLRHTGLRPLLTAGPQRLEPAP
jgi:undecaprenyl-diphosphatase